MATNAEGRGIKEFRFHDFRHDFATKLLRQTGNLKLVSKALNHADIKTTARYAHVLDEDIAVAVEQVQNPGKNPGQRLGRHDEQLGRNDNANCDANLRDVGVAGSNPATPTSSTLKRLN